jgi:hypothetical protein
VPAGRVLFDHLPVPVGVGVAVFVFAHGLAPASLPT